MIMRELNEEQLMELTQEGRTDCAVFLFTPMCGTCQAARRMLEVLEAMDDQLPLYAGNVNLTPRLAQNWQIESVPCVAFVQQGRLVEKMYAIQSVPALYERFLKYGLMNGRATGQ